MKVGVLKYLLNSISFVLLFVLLHSTAWADYQKNKIAVLPFTLQGEGFETQDMGDIVSEWLITAFVKDGRFEVVERKLLGQIMDEHKMAEAGVVSQASELGKLLGVKVIISGSVMKLHNTIEVNARIIDVASASIVTAENVRSLDLNQLQELVVGMAERIIRNFPLEGYIAQRDDNQVTITLGRDAGVRSGMMFTAYKDGKAIRHPKTDEILYVEQIRLGTIKILLVQPKFSQGLVIAETEPESIMPGVFVKSMIEAPPQTAFEDDSPAIDEEQLRQSSELLRQAEKAIQNEEFDEAETSLDRAELMALHPGDVKLLRQELQEARAKAREQQLRKDAEQERYLKDQAERQRLINAAETSFAEGKREEQKGRLEQALQHYEQAERDASRAGIALDGLASRKQEVEKRMQALKEYAKNAGTAYADGRKAEDQGKLRDALKHYRRAEADAGKAGIELEGLADRIKRVEQGIEQQKKAEPQEQQETTKPKRRVIGVF